jgi:hypothetical protein
MQWVQDPNQSNVDKQNNKIFDASRVFLKKEGISDS